ncbi:MAG TPA: TonB-dependent receptor plug domain-containing protein, partial [Gemmatimonadales bacterium]
MNIVALLTVVAAPQSQDTAKATTLSPVVVTATRVAIPAVTAGVTVITGDDLRAQGVTQVLDALRLVPGAFVVQSGSFGGQASLFLRGSQDNYTKVLLDGVPVNDPGGAFDFANLSTENIDRIEVVRGPASVLYGSDAVAGVIQIFTRRGAGRSTVSASALGGTFGTAQLDAGVSGSAGAGDYAFTVAQYQTDGIYAFNNHYRHTTLGGRVSAAPDSLTDLHVTLQYADNRAGIPTDGSGAVVDQNAFQYAQRFAFGLDLGRQFTRDVEGRLLLSSSTSDGGFNDLQDGPADTLGFYGSQNLDHIQRQSADMRLNVTLTPGVVATAGGALEVEQERSFNASQSQFGPSNGSFDAFRRNGAGYAQVVGTRDGFAWNASARLDDNQAFGTFGTYRVGAAYELPSSTRVRGALGTAFREPTFF